MSTTDIKKMTVQELKALAYDISVELGRAQQNLNIINNRIEQLLTVEKKSDVIYTDPKQE